MSSHGLRFALRHQLIISSHHVVFVGRMAALGSCKTNGQGGMSVIGWNHPGFGASSGSPDPRSEAEAIDAVLEFAQERLGYAIGEITLRAPQPNAPPAFLLPPPDECAGAVSDGWSIGGYPTCWAAMNHPALRGILLDAPFDDLTLLVTRHVAMPSGLHSSKSVSK